MLKTVHQKRCSRCSLWAVSAALLAPPLVAQEPASGRDRLAFNPFDGFETHYLSNGIRVFFNRLANAPDVFAGAAVFAGRLSDPIGKEQLAHLVEHVLLSDRGGQSELELRDAIKRLGGDITGSVGYDQSWYYVTVGREHGLFAIEWLAGVISPRRVESELVERNRRPIEIELGLRRPDLIERTVDFLRPSWLDVPLFWEREFGPAWRRDRSPDLWRSLHSLSAEDVQEFYDRYYAPGNMTVTIVGDLDRDQVLALAERTFGSIPPRTVHRWDPPVVDPKSGRGQYYWHFASERRPPGVPADYYYMIRNKLYHPSAEDVLLTNFVRAFLKARIDDRLRFGENKVAYQVTVAFDFRGATGTLDIAVDVTADEYDFATQAIEDEIEMLRTGTLDPSRFEATRARLVATALVANRSPWNIGRLASRRFQNRAIHTDVGNLPAFYTSITQDEVATFAARLFADSNRVTRVRRLVPGGRATVWFGALVLLGVALALAKWEPGERVRPDDILYIAGMCIPLALRAGYTAALGAFLFVAVVTGGTAYEMAVSLWLAPIDNFALQATVHAAVFVAGSLLLCRVLAWVPHELVVARDHLRLRSRTSRSRVLKPDQIAEITLRGFRSIWLTRRLFRGLPLTFGIRRPGIYIRPVRGRTWFFESRNTGELEEILVQWRESSAHQRQPARPVSPAQAQPTPVLAPLVAGPEP